jgi:hypothetical protein
MPEITWNNKMLFSNKSSPELISLHIPKTAGTSFRNILKNVYGEKEVVRFDIDPNGITMINEIIYEKKSLPDVKVIHGHFVYKSLIDKYTLPKNYKLITWVRDPVKRVISNFYYLESRLKEILDEEKRNLNILSKMQRSLLEYSRDELNRNRQSKFIAGSNLSDFNFIGIQEFFDDEIIRLSRILEWNKQPEPLHQNKTTTQAQQHSLEILNEIRELNKDDQRLYEEALLIRNKSIDTVQ